MRACLPLAAATALLLAGCSFGPKVPKSLLALPATAQVPPGTARSATDGQAILIGVPAVPSELTALRIPVRTTPTEIVYIKDAQWADAPARLFRNVLAETVTARTGRVVIEPRGANVTPGMRLGGRLQTFGLDAATHMAVVTYDASLARAGTDTVATQRFQARIAVEAEDGPTVAAALTQAANQVATEVATWVGR